MTMPEPGDGTYALLTQILAEQARQGVTLGIMSEQLKRVPDHELRLRVLERDSAADRGAGRVKAAVGASAAGVVSAGAALWVAIAHAR